MTYIARKQMNRTDEYPTTTKHAWGNPYRHVQSVPLFATAKSVGAAARWPPDTTAAVQEKAAPCCWTDSPRSVFLSPHAEPFVPGPAHNLAPSDATVLAKTPAWWTPKAECCLRKSVWAALRHDDPVLMEKALWHYSWGAAVSSPENPGRVGWELGHLLLRLRLALWRAHECEGGGLLHTAACNVGRVPVGGALRCLARLLVLHPPGQEDLRELQTAVRDTNDLGRHDATRLLLPHLPDDRPVAVTVLAEAPAWWSPIEEGKLRKKLWAALGNDDAGKMQAALREYSRGWELGHLLLRLRLALWSGSKGKGPSGKRRGLLHAAACNVAGVPEGGALRCLERLLELHAPGPEDAWQLRTAVRDTQELGRFVANQLLLTHLRHLTGTIEV